MNVSVGVKFQIRCDIAENNVYREVPLRNSTVLYNINNGHAIKADFEGFLSDV